MQKCELVHLTPVDKVRKKELVVKEQKIIKSSKSNLKQNLLIADPKVHIVSVQRAKTK